MLQIPEVLQPINVNDMLTPLSIIPMQYPAGGQRLLSDWPDELCGRVYRLCRYFGIREYLPILNSRSETNRITVP